MAEINHRSGLTCKQADTSREWHEGEVGAPRDRRLLLIATPKGMGQ
jgi:hypothetical protein